MSKFFRIPFANSGTKTAVPDDSQTDGTVNYTDGYGPDYSLNSASNPAALNIERAEFNEIIFDVTDAIRQYQINGTPDFITTSDNDGVAFPYAINSLVRYNAGSGFQIYRSLNAANTALPSDTAHWAIVNNLADGDKGDIVVSSNGTVFTIDTGVVVTGNLAANAVTNVKLGQMATLTIKSNITGSLANASDNTLSAIIDASFPTPSQGDILYRGPSLWAVLAPGAIGQFLKTNGSAANPTWAGSLLQDVVTLNSAVATGTTITPYDDTIPQITEGTEFMTVTITPKINSSKLKFSITVNYAHTISTWITIALHQDSTANALAAVSQFITSTNAPYSTTFDFEMTSGTTSATTFRVRIGGATGSTLTFNGVSSTRQLGGVNASSISVQEITA